MWKSLSIIGWIAESLKEWMSKNKINITSVKEYNKEECNKKHYNKEDNNLPKRPIYYYY